MPVLQPSNPANYGLLANRPATATDKSLYFATDVLGGTLYEYQNGSWVALTPGDLHAANHAPGGSDDLFLPHSTPTAMVETFPRWAVGTYGQPTLGAASFCYLTPPYGLTISKIGILVSSTAPSGQTLSRLGLYTVDGSGNLTLVARTANLSATITAAFTRYTPALDTTGGYPASYALARGARYAIGYIQVGGTAASIRGLNATDSATLAVSPFLCGNVTGQTDLPTSVSAAAIGNGVAGGGGPLYLQLIP